MPTPLLPRHLLRFDGLGDPQWSPAGRQVAFTHTTFDAKQDKRVTRIALLDVKTGKTRPLTSPGTAARGGASGGDRMPRWSPDGSQLAFLSTRCGKTHLYRIAPDGGEAQALTHDDMPFGPIMADDFYAGLSWSPDGKSLAFVAQDPGGPRDIIVGEDSTGLGYESLHRAAHVWTLHLETGALRQLTGGRFHHADPQWTPDGKAVICVSDRSGVVDCVTYNIRTNHDLYRVPLRGRAVRLTDNPGPDFLPAVSPDGRAIAHLASDRCGPHYDAFELRLLDLTRRQVTTLVTRPHVRALRPQWSEDGRWIYFSAWTDARERLLRVDRSGGVEAVKTPAKRNVMQASLRRGVPAYLSDAADASMELTVGRHTTSFNVAASKAARSRRTLVKWASDGETIEGVLTVPSRSGRRAWPLVVMPHGGPHGYSRLGHDAGADVLASHGYAVLSPNFRGSLGRGKAFVDAARGDVGGADYRDVIAGVNRLIERGIADPKQLHIMGTSFGGYLTMQTIGLTRRFRRAIAINGVTDLRAFFGSSDIPFWAWWEIGGHAWEKPGAYARCSPITRAHTVTTPTLLLVGTADRRVPPSQSLAFYRTLRAVGTRCELVQYRGETHGISKPANVRDMWDRILAWLR